jgi:Deoxyribonuclease NucA/NucB
MAAIFFYPPFWVAVGEAATAAAPYVAGALGVAVVGKVAVDQMSKAEENAKAKEKTGVTTDTCTTGKCPCHRVVVISKTAHPQSAQHILDAQASGYPSTLTIERTGASARRRASTGGYPRVAGMQPDEYPPAMFLEGGAGASVRNIKVGP